jgi:hypothetical protein
MYKPLPRQRKVTSEFDIKIMQNLSAKRRQRVTRREVTP